MTYSRTPPAALADADGPGQDFLVPQGRRHIPTSAPVLLPLPWSALLGNVASQSQAGLCHSASTLQLLLQTQEGNVATGEP